jgi:cytochrome bd-type quinol oxidase subunit 2
MIHPLLGKLATQPGLFAEHAGAYAELAAVEARQLGHRWRRQVLLALAAALMAALALGLAGVSALLAAALPVHTMPAPVVLVLLPALPLVMAALCAWWARGDGQAAGFALLREQLRADAQLLRELDAA